MDSISDNSEAARAKKDQALALLNEQRLSEAKSLYEDVCRSNPRDVEGLFMLGMVHAQSNSFEEAETFLMRAAAIESDRAAIHYNLAKVRESLGKIDLAIQSYQNALNFKPEFAAAHNNIGTLYQLRGMNNEAVSSFREALRFEPMLAEAHFNLANSYTHQGKLYDALASYENALNISEDYNEMRQNFCGVLFRLGRHEEAADCYRLVLKSNPDDAQTYSNLGNVLKSHGEYETAVESYRHAVKIKPDFAEALNNMGIALKCQGKYQEAIAAYQEALTLRPVFAAANNNLGNVLRDIGNHEEAMVSFHRALRIDPDYADAYFNLHSLLIDKNDMRQAINCLENAIRVKPYNISYHFYLGALLEYAGDSEKATRYFKKVQSGSYVDKAYLDSWNYIKSTCKVPPTMIGSSIDAFRLGMDAAPKSGLVMEFGVRHGVTIRQIAKLVNQEVHGFDSFEGLPEAWHEEPKGSYTTKGNLPMVPDNVRLHAGWFENSLPEFLKKHKEPVRFMNVDCDLYSSTKTILDNFSSQIIPGSVILFDEYLGHAHWREDEFKAFQEAVKTYGWCYEYLAFSIFTKQVVVRILQA